LCLIVTDQWESKRGSLVFRIPDFETYLEQTPPTKNLLARPFENLRGDDKFQEIHVPSIFDGRTEYDGGSTQFSFSIPTQESLLFESRKLGLLISSRVDRHYMFQCITRVLCKLSRRLITGDCNWYVDDSMGISSTTLVREDLAVVKETL
jgi:hypothetical protein